MNHGSKYHAYEKDNIKKSLCGVKLDELDMKRSIDNFDVSYEHSCKKCAQIINDENN